MQRLERTIKSMVGRLPSFFQRFRVVDECRVRSCGRQSSEQHPEHSLHRLAKTIQIRKILITHFGNILLANRPCQLLDCRNQTGSTGSVAAFRT